MDAGPSATKEMRKGRKTKRVVSTDGRVVLDIAISGRTRRGVITRLSSHFSSVLARAPTPITADPFMIEYKSLIVI